MINNRRTLYIGAALLLAIVTVVMTQQWLQREAGRASASAQTGAPTSSLKVLVAARSLAPGSIIGRDDVTWQPWPASGNVEGYFADSASKTVGVVGAVVRNGLARGEPLTRDGVVQPGDRSFLAAVLRPGYRAVSIALTASTGVAGFIRPGDRVDVILSRVSQGGGARSVAAETILGDVRVVGIDQRATGESSDIAVPQTATLEVTPAQAEAIAGATELGKLSLALLSVAAADGQMGQGVNTPVLPLQRASSRQRARVSPVAAKRSSLPAAITPTVAPVQTVEIIRGTDVSTESFLR